MKKIKYCWGFQNLKTKRPEVFSEASFYDFNDGFGLAETKKRLLANNFGKIPEGYKPVKIEITFKIAK